MAEPGNPPPATAANAAFCANINRVVAATNLKGILLILEILIISEHKHLDTFNYITQLFCWHKLFSYMTLLINKRIFNINGRFLIKYPAFATMLNL
jgi:hypothetical protein